MKGLSVFARLGEPETPGEWKKRLLAEGKLVSFKLTGEAPVHEKLADLSRGWGSAVSEELDWTRGDR